jgi:hypothetical protein
MATNSDGGATEPRSVAISRLEEKAREMASQSTHPDAASLDVAAWLAAWLHVPQPALGGRAPQDMLDSEEGVAAVLRVLGAIQSGVYL